MAVVDQATVSPPVASPPLKQYEHAVAWRAHGDVLGRIRDTLKALREEAGPEPRELKSRVIIERISDARYQVYFPDLGVAGEGRCVCEASLEAVHALEVILESALDHKDWAVLPAPDRSLKTMLAAIKTGLFIHTVQYLDARLSAEDVRSCKRVQSDLALAVV